MLTRQPNGTKAGKSGTKSKVEIHVQNATEHRCRHMIHRGERMLRCNFVSFGGMTCPGIQLHKFDCSFAVREELQQDSNTNTLDGYLDAACVQVASFPDLSSNVYCTREYLEILDDRMPGLDQVPLQLQLSQSSIKASSGGNT